MTANMTDLERLRDEVDSDIINVTVDGKYYLFETCHVAFRYQIEDEIGHSVPLNEVEYLDWKYDNFGDLFDECGDMREVDEDGYIITDKSDNLKSYHTLSLWYDNTIDGHF